MKFANFLLVVILISQLVYLPASARPGEAIDSVLKRYDLDGQKPITQGDYVLYKISNSRFVSQPTLFFKAQAESKPTTKLGATSLDASPEQTWEQQLGHMIQELNRLLALLPLLFYPQQPFKERHYLEQRLEEAVALMNRLQQSLRRIPYVQHTDGTHRTTTSSSGSESAGNQSPTEPITS